MRGRHLKWAEVPHIDHLITEPGATAPFHHESNSACPSPLSSHAHYAILSLRGDGTEGHLPMRHLAALLILTGLIVTGALALSGAALAKYMKLPKTSAEALKVAVGKFSTGPQNP